MVLLIVIAQALPVFLVGVMSGSKHLLWLTAIVMFFIAAITGSPSYFVADFIGIAIAVGAAYAVMEPPAPPRNDPPKPSSAPPQAPLKPETRVIEERKPVPSSLPKADEEGSQKALWFSVACGVFFLIWLVSGPDKSQTSSRTVGPVINKDSSKVENSMYECYQNGMTFYRTQPCPFTTQSIKTKKKIEPIYKPTTPLVTEKNKSSPEKPSKPKPEPDPLVKKIQQNLLSLGYSPGSADGYIGPKTLNAIRQFQKENRLPIDSKINAQLLSNLNLAQPRVVPQHRQEPTSNSSVESEKKDSICPIGQICVHHSRESYSPNSDNKKSDSTRNPVQPDAQKPNSAIDNHMKHMQRSYPVLCPEGRICPPF